MSVKSFVLGVFLVSSASVSMASSIENVVFEGNIKIPTKKLTALSRSYIGKPLDSTNAAAIAGNIESFYHQHRYELAHASVQKIDENQSSITISIGKYADFNERAIEEMKRRELKPNAINQIFFVGNEKISSQRLIHLVQPSLGLEKTSDNLNAILKNVQNYYRSHRYELAYAEIAQTEENGIITIAIKKYPNFKARYTKEGKS